MIYTEADNRRESWIAGGWNVGADDDVPHWPEPDPMSSAQSRRWWRLVVPGKCSKHQIGFRASDLGPSQPNYAGLFGPRAISSVR